MLDAGLDFLVPPLDRRAVYRIAEIAACAFDDIHAFWILVAAVRTSESIFRRFEVAVIVAFIAVVNRCIGPEVTHSVIGIIPYRLQRFEVMRHLRILAVVDEAATRNFRVVLFEIDLLKRRYVLTDIIVE